MQSSINVKLPWNKTTGSNQWCNLITSSYNCCHTTDRKCSVLIHINLTQLQILIFRSKKVGFPVFMAHLWTSCISLPQGYKMSTDPYELLTYGNIRKLKLDTTSALFKLCCKEDGQKLLDFRRSFDGGYGEPSTSEIAGMKCRSWNGAQVYRHNEQVSQGFWKKEIPTEPFEFTLIMAVNLCTVSWSVLHTSYSWGTGLSISTLEWATEIQQLLTIFFVFKAVSDGGDFYIDPPRLLCGRMQWQFNESGHCRERGLQTPAGPLIYLNFAEYKNMYEHRLNMDGQYYLNAAASEGSDWQHTVRREDYFFFNLESETASAFFGQILCLKELLPRPFGLRSRPNQRAPKRSQLFVMREHA